VRGRAGDMADTEFVPNTVYVTYIASTPEKVWQALTDPTFTRQYFGGFEIEVEPRQGGTFLFRYPDGRVHMSGRVVEWVPPRRLSCTRGWSKGCRISASCRSAW
jgi:uncharacterized protein YndB with AHSA1/START domain